MSLSDKNKLDNKKNNLKKNIVALLLRLMKFQRF